MSQSKHVTLAIESAISGGSISLLRGGVEIANWIGSSNVSKAEDLLFNIDLLLTDNDISKRDIGFIAVSAGPGSFTGIRIGIATALGLKAGLGVEMSSESALKAMVFAAESEGDVTVALPVGRNAVCIQVFSGARTLCPPDVQDKIANYTSGQNVRLPIGEPSTITEEVFYAMVESDPSTTFLIHERLYEKVVMPSNVINFGLGLANAVGRICQLNRGVVVEPLFISKSF